MRRKVSVFVVLLVSALALTPTARGADEARGEFARVVETADFPPGFEADGPIAIDGPEASRVYRGDGQILTVSVIRNDADRIARLEREIDATVSQRSAALTWPACGTRARFATETPRERVLLATAFLAHPGGSGVHVALAARTDREPTSSGADVIRAQDSACAAFRRLAGSECLAGPSQALLRPRAIEELGCDIDLPPGWRPFRTVDSGRRDAAGQDLWSALATAPHERSFVRVTLHPAGDTRLDAAAVLQAECERLAAHGAEPALVNEEDLMKGDRETVVQGGRTAHLAARISASPFVVGDQRLLIATFPLDDASGDVVVVHVCRPSGSMTVGTAKRIALSLRDRE